MKKVLIKVTATIFIFLFSGIISNLYSEEWTEKVVVDKKIEINKNAKLIIDHEFGNVRCKNWDQNAISVKVTIRVKTNDAQKAEKIINNVIVDVKGNRSEVVARCDLNQKKHGDKNVKVTIDFDIYMPETISLELEHQFGTAYIESVSGPTSISSEYGSLEIMSLSNTENDFEIKFGEANIKHISEGDLEIGYSQLELLNADIISIESEYSDISIDNAKSISLELEGGNVTIDKVGKLDAESSFSNLEIQYISESLTAETNYGNLVIKNVDKDFSSITIDNEFGAVAVNIDKNAIYNLLAEGEYCSFTYPDEIANISYKKESHSSTLIKGVVGKGANAKSTLNITSEYGSVNIEAQ